MPEVVDFRRLQILDELVDCIKQLYVYSMSESQEVLAVRSMYVKLLALVRSTSGWSRSGRLSGCSIFAYLEFARKRGVAERRAGALLDPHEDLLSSRRGPPSTAGAAARAP